MNVKLLSSLLASALIVNSTLAQTTLLTNKVQQRILQNNNGGNTTLNTGIKPTSDLGPYFIDGISVYPHFTYSNANAPAGTAAVAAYIANSSANVIGSAYSTTLSGGKWTCTSIDANTIPAGGYVYFAFFNGPLSSSNTQFLNVSKAYFPTIKPKPTWMTKQGFRAVVASVNRTSGEIAFEGKMALTDLFFQKLVVGEGTLKNTKFKLNSVDLEFGGEYNTKTSATSASPTKLSSGLSFKEGQEKKYGMFNGFNGTLSFDNAFNPTVLVNATFGPKYGGLRKYELWNKEVFYTLAGVNGPGLTVGGLCLGAAAEFSVAPSIKAQIVYGKVGSSWGLSTLGSDKTSLLFSAEATAALQGTLYLACASFMGKGGGYGTLARVRAEAKVALMAGITGTTVPTRNLAISKGAKATLTGTIDVLGSRVYSNTFYSKAWGDPFKTTVGTGAEFDNAINYTARTTQRVAGVTPNAWPSGVISTQDSVLAAVWLDDINFGTQKALLATHYDPQIHTFSTPTIVALNDSAILMPSCKLLPNKDVLVTWAQLSMPTSAINQNTMSTDDIIRKQEIWIAIINPLTQTIIYKGKLNDATGNRADGEPKIHWGAGNKGMITWQANDATSGFGSDIYYSEIQYNSSNYSLAPASILADLPGNNYKVEIAYTNGNNAIAEWMNDNDASNDSTNYSTNVMMSTWDGNAWTQAFTRYGTDSNFVIKDFSLAVEGTNGVEAVTYSYRNLDTLMVDDTLHFNGVVIGTWTDGDPFGTSFYSNFDTSSTYTYTQPRAAVNINGLGSLTMKQNNVFDTLDYGHTAFWLKDIYDNSTPWEDLSVTNPTVLDVLQDTNMYSWDVSSKFGFMDANNAGNILYLFTQEIDKQGNTNPTHGEVFGQPNLNLVLRAFRVERNGTSFALTDVPEPTTTNVVTFYQKIAPFKYGFELKQNYPNPFTGSTTIPFHIGKAGRATIELIDVTGRKVATIFDDNVTGGDYQTEFESSSIPSGIYFYKITINGTSDIRKMVVAN